MFTPHLHSLELIKKNLKNANYSEAKKNINAHLKAELQGAAILVNLKKPIVAYEASLRRIADDLEDLKDPTAPDRLLIRKKCIGELEVARQQLQGLHHYIEELADVYFKK